MPILSQTVQELIDHLGSKISLAVVSTPKGMKLREPNITEIRVSIVNDPESQIAAFKREYPTGHTNFWKAESLEEARNAVREVLSMMGESDTVDTTGIMLRQDCYILVCGGLSHKATLDS